MQIPEIKSMLVYRNIDNIKKVLCNYIETDNEYSTVEFEIEYKNPFKDQFDEEFECHRRNDGSYALVIYDKDTLKKKGVMDCWVTYVLVYKDKLFELKETNSNIIDGRDYDF
nr:hypothetical protein 5 [Bacillaceae bacterium]